ncbi:MAG: deoxyribose-phosphate aldolase [Lachnospiraceae bacterium]|nr:deoxyribose-phosphate aldolase [Lachnospiraceae bacterium]
MQVQNWNQYFDHTNLAQDATKEEIITLCKEAKQYQFASVCVNPCRVGTASQELKNSGVEVCTVVGFPLGANQTSIKVMETKKAIKDGATEIDMVMNIGALKDGDYNKVKKDIKRVKKACSKNAILKVILETGMLEEKEIIKACQLAVAAKADFVKTSTGFYEKKATVEAVKIMKDTVKDKAKVKAAGGIRDLKTAKEMIEAGADRLGTSATVNIVKEME